MSPLMSSSLFPGLALYCLFAFAPAWAQTSGYTKLSVKNRVQLEIPEDWIVNDAENRQRVRDFAAKLTGIAAGHTAALSAASYPVPSRMFVRISFIPLEPPISQADVRREVQANRQQVIRDLADTWMEESPAMWSGLAKQGIREVGRATFAVEQLGGQTALVIRYARTSSVNAKESMKVTQYHVPLGTEKALVTLSYIDGDRTAMAAHDQLKSTIAIK